MQDHVSGSGATQAPKQRELAVVILMALGFGLVGIDRFLITTMFPTISAELKLDYADIGIITGALAFAWGLAALFIGNLSDYVGRRLVLVGSLVVFALLIGGSGLAASLAGLVAVRIVMGVADGAYTPASIAATIEASAPQRHGLNIGIQQMMLPLCGLGLGPLAVGALLHVIDWRQVFLIFVIPGFVLAFAVWKVLPSKTSLTPVSRPSLKSSLADWRAVLAVRNVRVAAAMMLCWLTCLMTTSAFLPNYLIDYLRLPFESMPTVMSAIGVGSTVGTLLLPWLSDKVGRRPVMGLSALGALISLVLLAICGPDPVTLFACLFAVHAFNNALITLTVGPICIESVPVTLAATASGLVIAVAELFGGGLAPVIVGQVSQRFGLVHMLWLPIAMMVVGLILTRSLRETRGGVASL